MSSIKALFLNIIFFLVIDFIWLKFIIGSYFLEILGPIARVKNGDFDVHIGSAIVVYVLMAVALEFFVLKHRMGTFTKVFQGSLLGFVIYGIYDFTNYALIRDYPQEMLIVDVIWGTFLFGLVSYIRSRMKPKNLFI